MDAAAAACVGERERRADEGDGCEVAEEEDTVAVAAAAADVGALLVKATHVFFSWM